MFVEVEVRGNKAIRHRVNGQFVFEYGQPQLDPNDAGAKKLIENGRLMLDGGSISLRAERHPCEFRSPVTPCATCWQCLTSPKKSG